MEYRLPYDVASVSSARRLVGDFAEAQLSDRRLDELVLVASEVVTNAVTHGSAEPDGGIGLRLEEDQEAVRVVVTDGGEGLALDPGSIEDANRDEHFGLLLVDRFADRWGSPWTARWPSGWRLTLPFRCDTEPAAQPEGRRWFPPSSFPRLACFAPPDAHRPAYLPPSSAYRKQPVTWSFTRPQACMNA